MTAITFDAFRYMKNLEKGGYTREQAETQATALQEALTETITIAKENSVSKEEFVTFKSEMREDFQKLSNQVNNSELRMTIKVGAMLMALGGFLVAVKYFG